MLTDSAYRLILLSLLAFNSSVAKGTCEKPIDKECDLRKPQVVDGNVVGCLSLEQKPRTIYDNKTWKFVQDVYWGLFYSQTEDFHEYGYADEFEHYIMDGEDSEDEENTDAVISIVVPHEVRHKPDGGGRGVFLTEDVKESEVVYYPDAYGVWRTESGWRKFVSIIANANIELACDVLQWSYVQVLEDDSDDVGIAMDLSIASYLNHGGIEKRNILSVNEMHIANRDIAAGEELLDDYLQYYQFGKLQWYEDMVANAWADECNPSDCGLDSDSSEEQRWNYRITRKK